MTNQPNMTPEMEAALSRANEQISSPTQTNTNTNTPTAPGAQAAEGLHQPPISSEQPQVEVETAQTPTEIAKEVEVKAETATPTPTENIFDLFGDDKKAAETTETSQKPTEDYRAKYDELRSVLDDPEMVELINIKKSGGSLVDFAKQYTPVEYAKLSIEELTAQYGKANNWSDDDIASEVELLSSKGKVEQSQLRKAMQSELESVQQDKFKKLVADNSKQIAEQNVIAEKSMAKLDELSKKLPGRDMYNVMKLTDEHAAQFREFSTNPPITAADGTINENFMFAAFIGMKLMPELHKSLQSTNQTLGRMDVMKEINRKTGDNAAVITTVPANGQGSPKPANPKELADEFYNRRSPN